MLGKLRKVCGVPMKQKIFLFGGLLLGLLCLTCAYVTFSCFYTLKEERWREFSCLHDGKFVLYYVEPNTFFVISPTRNISDLPVSQSTVKVRGFGHDGEEMSIGADSRRVYRYDYNWLKQKCEIFIFDDVTITVVRGRIIEINGERFHMRDFKEPSIFIVSEDRKIEKRNHFDNDFLGALWKLGFSCEDGKTLRRW